MCPWSTKPVIRVNEIQSYALSEIIHYWTIQWFITGWFNDSLLDDSMIHYWMIHYCMIQWFITGWFNDSLLDDSMIHYCMIQRFITGWFNDSLLDDSKILVIIFITGWFSVFDCVINIDYLFSTVGTCDSGYPSMPFCGVSSVSSHCTCFHIKYDFFSSRRLSCLSVIFDMKI